LRARISYQVYLAWMEFFALSQITNAVAGLWHKACGASNRLVENR
jgi:hypothetical protein